jgi:exportin-1
MADEFTPVFELVNGLLSASEAVVPPALTKACLETLLAFMSWMPFQYIFQSDLIPKLAGFFGKDSLRNLAFRNLIEVAALEFPAEQGGAMLDKLVALCQDLEGRLDLLLPVHSDLLAEVAAMQKGNPRMLPHFEEFCTNIALFYTSLFRSHLPQLEALCSGSHSVHNLIHKGLRYLVMLTNYPSDQCFKIVCEYWLGFTTRLLAEGLGASSQSLLSFYGGESNPKESIYRKVLAELRHILVFRMVKPEEVKIVIDENGMPQLEEQANTDQASMCELLHQIVVNLTKLDEEGSRSILIAKLERQYSATEYSFERLNSLCWAVGAMPGILEEAKERIFLVSVVKILLSLCENKKGKENKAVIATNIMYVVGRYPSFLNNNWIFLKTVVKKLYEFMRETFPGIMEMAVKTLLKISECSKMQFVILQSHERAPFIEEMVAKIAEDAGVLAEDGQRLIFY